MAAIGYRNKQYLNLWKMPLCGKNTNFKTSVTVSVSWDLTPCFVVANRLIILFVFRRSQLFFIFRPELSNFTERGRMIKNQRNCTYSVFKSPLENTRTVPSAVTLEKSAFPPHIVFYALMSFFPLEIFNSLDFTIWEGLVFS